MKLFALTPHVGIGPIKPGATRPEVRAAMSGIGCALESARRLIDYFCDSSVQVEYEEDETASFIGISSNEDLSLTFEGLNLFDLEAKEVFVRFAQCDGSGDHLFSELQYVFPSQVVTLYEADSQYDRSGGETRQVWGQIGCGDQRYLDATLKIHNGILNPPPPKRT